jgi:pimeloyl-[acyl-carrier protein] methyl ester esterase
MSRLYTEVSGNGPALVLLHGWGLNVRIWDGLAAALSDRFRIIAVDLPGHGHSAWLPERSSLEEQAAQVRETVAGIVDGYSLLGWSLGSEIALQLAAGAGASAAAIHRLMLVAATPRFVAAPDWPHGAPPDRLAAQAGGLRSDYRRTVSEFLELQVRASADGGEALQQMRAALFAHGSHGSPDSPSGLQALNIAALARGLELLRDNDLRPLLPEITIPTLVVAGQYDRVIMPAASHALADALPNGRYVEIRRAAHAPFLSHLSQFSALIRDFLLQT